MAAAVGGGGARRGGGRGGGAGGDKGKDRDENRKRGAGARRPPPPPPPPSFPAKPPPLGARALPAVARLAGGDRPATQTGAVGAGRLARPLAVVTARRSRGRFAAMRAHLARGAATRRAAGGCCLAGVDHGVCSVWLKSRHIFGWYDRNVVSSTAAFALRSPGYLMPRWLWFFPSYSRRCASARKPW